jgi:DNA-binding IclR family transcriptional regulator
MIQVIQRALNILELISKDRNKEFGLGEIADSLGLNHGTCANIIKTLVVREYLEQSGNKRGYKLGTRSYYLTGNYSNKKELLRIAVEPVKALRAILNESCILAIVKDNMRVTLHKELSTHGLQVVKSGEEKNVYLTATGRIILACMNPMERGNFIQKYGLPNEMWNEVKNNDDLIIELQKIKEKQLAIHFDGAHIVGIAAPIYKNEEVIASLGIYLPEARFTYKEQEKILLELNKTVQQISEELKSNIENIGKESRRYRTTSPKELI